MIASPIERPQEKEFKNINVMLPIVKVGENSIHVDQSGILHSALNLTNNNLRNLRRASE